MGNERIASVLESVGLNKNEIIIYLSLLKRGKSSAIELAKDTKLHRSNTYDVLEKLKEKGIVDESIENEKKFFYPIEPEDLIDYLKQKQEELEEIIPEIEKIHKYSEEERRVTISEGMNSVKNILAHLIDLKEPIYSFGIKNIYMEKIGGFVDQLNRLRIKRKIPLKQIYEDYNPKIIKEMNQLDHTETKYLATTNPGNSTFIAGDKAIMILWDSPPAVILIQSKYVAESYTEYFKILWEHASVPQEIL